MGALIKDGDTSAPPILNPISDPSETEDYYRSVKSAKVAAILRMIENEFSLQYMINAIAV